MKVYDTVKAILEKYPESRDSDKLLMFMVWSKVIYNTPTGYDSLQIDLNTIERLPSPETIRRSRQKIQELNEGLRGSKLVTKLRKKVEAQKGTHIYREVVQDVLFQEDVKPRNTVVW